MQLKINAPALKGSLKVPGDKSISHRAVIFGAMAHGLTEIRGILKSQDVKATIAAFSHMGVGIVEKADCLFIYGKGYEALQAPHQDLDMGNSGTSMRLISGLLAGQNFTTTLKGDASLSRRPMDRIAIPLKQMGALIEGQGDKQVPPLTIRGTKKLRPVSYQLPVASAQVKSAILLAALQTEGETQVIEKELTRSHTEEMIQAFGGHLVQKGKNILIKGPQELQGQKVEIPGDISSAAFWMVAASIVAGSQIKLENVGINPSRTGIIDVLKQMGGKLTIESFDAQKMSATIKVSYAKLKGIEIGGELIPRLIDELPIIALLATQAQGQTIIRDAAELRLKETDRIAAVTSILQAMGADIQATSDGMIIKGKSQLQAYNADAQLDHRIAMMTAIAALVVKKGHMELKGQAAIETSYPNFFKDLERLYHD
ncbi:3-phosphoshikimate 1-carboxyvinyltransferase [Streptococcus didelphis]|uniref:3-phosphoshikimate 1-carboxyvinyltransferase n=1 Tax=Streptococcus didelphis TaxID=102886 RepID=UPI00036C5BFE|nr:3-phosphoshikimate 1-carboxyvinyltransferase [Streptococcus didelphis]